VNTEKSIAEVHRVLKPGGEAVIMLYNRNSWFNFVAWLSGTNVEHKDKDAPIIRKYTASECRKLFHRFAEVDIHLDRFPKKTVKFGNAFAKLNNYLLVPFFSILPDAIRRPLGWHIMIRARK
jgi:SAM-dependent methyltransferase